MSIYGTSYTEGDLIMTTPAPQISALDAAIEQVDSTFKRTDEIRDFLIVKMKAVLEEMILNPNEDSPKTTESKLMAVQTLQNLLKDKESGAVTIAKTKMQKKDTESSEAARQMVVELLKHIDVRQTNSPVGQTVIPGDLDKVVDASMALTKRSIYDT